MCWLLVKGREAKTGPPILAYIIRSGMECIQNMRSISQARANHITIYVSTIYVITPATSRNLPSHISTTNILRNGYV